MSRFFENIHPKSSGNAAGWQWVRLSDHKVIVYWKQHSARHLTVRFTSYHRWVSLRTFPLNRLKWSSAEYVINHKPMDNVTDNIVGELAEVCVVDGGFRQGVWTMEWNKRNYAWLLTRHIVDVVKAEWKASKLIYRVTYRKIVNFFKNR